MDKSLNKHYPHSTLVDDPEAHLLSLQRQLKDRMHKHLDASAESKVINVGIFGGMPRGRKTMAYAMAHNLPVTLFRPNIKSLGEEAHRLSDAIDRFIEQFDQFPSKGRISAEDLMGIANAQPQSSRRGRNIKPDESRKARYSTPRSRQ